MKTANSSKLCNDFAQGLDVLEEHKRPFLETSEFWAKIYFNLTTLEDNNDSKVKVENQEKKRDI